MRAPFFTTVVAVDEHHVDALRLVWPTWRKFKPELVASPLLVICDGLRLDYRDWQRRLTWLDHPSRQLVCWGWPDRDDSEMAGMTQRERMFSAFVHLPHRIVQTAYWLKLDVDTVATAPGPWIDREWFRVKPAAVAPPWGYTKPARWVDDLNRWAASVPGLAELPERHQVRDPDAATFGARRWCSWLAWVDTAWSRYASSLSPGRLPVPSQDTYHWYLTDRRGDLVTLIRPKKFGWDNISSRRRREQRVREVLG